MFMFKDFIFMCVSMPCVNRRSRPGEGLASLDWS